MKPGTVVRTKRPQPLMPDGAWVIPANSEGMVVAVNHDGTLAHVQFAYMYYPVIVFEVDNLTVTK